MGVNTGSSVWSRVLALSTVFFLIGLSDSVLSYWVPPFVQKTLGSALLMGVVLSFSSIVGLSADIVLPQLLQGAGVRKLIMISVFLSLGFGALLLLSYRVTSVFVLLLAMGTWGVYYELLNFSRQQFLANNTPHNIHASASAVLFTFRGLAYTIGPLIAGFLLTSSTQAPIVFALVITVIGGLALRISRLGSGGHVNLEIKNVNFVSELKHWKTLFRVVWPMIAMSIFMGIIDSVFWTSGTVFSEKMSGNIIARFILPAYMLPMVLVGPLLARMNIVSGKKRKAQILYLVSGFLLVLVGFADNLAAVVFFVFASSVMSAAAYPLVDAVYGDMVERLGRQRWHLIGLSSSATSVAYIVGPILSGFVSGIVGEQKTFAVFGIGAVVLSVVLLFTTKRKFTLPQSEIARWV